MYFSTLTVSTTAMILAAMTLLPLYSLAVKTDCDRCVDSLMIKMQPACAKLPYLGPLNTFSDSKLTPEHRKCFCSIPSSDNSWYQSCYLSEKCDSQQMDWVAESVSVITSKTVCPAPGSAEAAAMNSGNVVTSANGVAMAAAAAAVVSVFL
ncbi:hypothetical protein BGW39_005315 [Mortierella sp. 14UC]|nr:hypothetical protein BGW39_005315 [Mortierella sp. 14UC]